MLPCRLVLSLPAGNLQKGGAENGWARGIAELFLPDTYPAREVLKWNRLYDLMEQAIDRCEDLSNLLQNVVLKNA